MTGFEFAEPQPQRRIRLSSAAFLILQFDDTPAHIGKIHTQRQFESGLPYSVFDVAYENEQQGETLAVVSGERENWLQNPDGPLVRLESACGFSLAGDTALKWLTQLNEYPSTIPHEYPSHECDCEAQAHYAFELIATEGGIFFDLAEQEARNLGAATYEERVELKSAIYSLMANERLTTYEACARLGVPVDTRDYMHCGNFLRNVLGLDRIRLLSNNPEKLRQLSDCGIEVTRIEHVPEITQENIGYLKSKQSFGHAINRNL